MRIVNSVLGDATGGRWQVVCNYSRVLSQRGHTVLMLLSEKHLPDLDKISAGVSVEVIRSRGHYDYPAAWSAGRRLRDFAPDLAIAHCSRSVALLKRATRGVVPVVAVTHSNKVTRLLPADAYLPLTSHIEQTIKRAAKASFRKPCFIVPNMIAVEAARLPAVRQRHHPLRIGALGRFDKVKGFDVFVDALGVLRARGLPFEAVLGGSGIEQHRLTEQARLLGLSDQLSFPGWIAEVDNFLANVDILVVPARSDAFGLTPLQAAVAGVPLLLSTAFGHREMFEDEVEALYCGVGEALSTADQLARLMTDTELADSLRRAAYRRTLLDYSEMAVSEKLFHALESIEKYFH
ncbi:MAG: glycosyltransferase family 4 protein [Pseudomonadota bacterium]|nr:glycosyltransferase family 4 protein [Pseudomonadota bacterium]